MAQLGVSPEKNAIQAKIELLIAVMKFICKDSGR